MSVEEHDDQSVKGHVVQATKKYRRAIDEERELKELVEQRQALENKVEEEDENQEQLDALNVILNSMLRERMNRINPKI